MDELEHPSRVDRARAMAKELLPWGSLAAFTVAAVYGNLGPDLKKVLLEWGPGLLIFLVVMQQAPALVRASQRQADAMASLAGELKELPRRDEFKFQDLMIGQELILRQLADLQTRVSGCQAAHSTPKTPELTDGPRR